MMVESICILQPKKSVYYVFLTANPRKKDRKLLQPHTNPVALVVCAPRAICTVTLHPFVINRCVKDQKSMENYLKFCDGHVQRAVGRKMLSSAFCQNPLTHHLIQTVLKSTHTTSPSSTVLLCLLHHLTSNLTLEQAPICREIRPDPQLNHPVIHINKW